MTTQTIIDITDEKIVGLARERLAEGYRLVQICCSKVEENKLEIQYSYDRNFEFISYKLTLINTDKSIPSISSVYLPACLYENEIHDLFGVKVEGMAIDFNGKFYQKTMKTPFNQTQPAGEAK